MNYKLFFAIYVLIISNLSVYAEDYTCNDGICDLNENFYSCPEDCKEAVIDNYCNTALDNVCDLDCVELDPDCGSFSRMNKQESDYSSLLITFAAAGMFIFIAVFIVFIYKKISLQKQEQDARIYDTETINRFSNIEKKNEATWSNQSEAEILNKIKKDEKYNQYFQK